MKTIPFLLILFLNFIVVYTGFAQKTAYYLTIEEELQLARELYRHEKYNAAYRQFEKVQKQVEAKSEIYSEALFFKASSALKAGHSSGNRFLEKFIDDYPESPYINRALFDLSEYQFEKKQYAAVLRSYKKVDQNTLNKDELIKLRYHAGYSYLMQDSTEHALNEFEQIRNENNIYSRSATYYWAHIMYLQEN